MEGKTLKEVHTRDASRPSIGNGKAEGLKTRLRDLWMAHTEWAQKQLRRDITANGNGEGPVNADWGWQAQK